MATSLDSGESEKSDESSQANEQFVSMLRRGHSMSGQERHCAFLNTGGSRFATVSAVSGLDFPDDGRAIAVVDWDQDGDQDLWISNRNAPRLRFMRNDNPVENHFLALRLRGNGTTTNRDGIGARVEIIDGSDKKLKRIQTLHGGQGFISQSSKWLHFGLGTEQTINQVIVHWPGGDEQVFEGLDLDQRYELAQGEEKPRVVPARPPIDLAPSTPKLPEPTNMVRNLLPAPFPMLPIEFTDFKGNPHRVQPGMGKAILINLWASWCPNCAKELKEFSERASDFREAGIDVVALNVDRLGETETEPGAAAQMAKDFELPFPSGDVTPALMRNFEALYNANFLLVNQLPLPSSLLIDKNGGLIAFYHGPVGVDEILRDVDHGSGSLNDRMQRAAFLAGSTIEDPVLATRNLNLEVVNRLRVAEAINNAGDKQEALKQYLDVLALDASISKAHTDLAGIYLSQGESQLALEQFELAVKVDPAKPEAQHNLGAMLFKQGNPELAKQSFEEAIRLIADDTNSQARVFSSAHKHLGLIDVKIGEANTAIEHFRKAASGDSPPVDAVHQLAWVLATTDVKELRNPEEAVVLASFCAEKTNFRNPTILETLGISHAAAGDFESATQWIQQALSMTSNPEKIRLLTEVLRKFEKGEAVEFPPQ